MCVCRSETCLHIHIYCSTVHISEVTEPTWCLPSEDWIKEMWFSLRKKCHLATENGMIPFAGKCVKLEVITLSNWPRKDEDHMRSLFWNLDINT